MRTKLFQKGVIQRGSRQKHNLGLGLYLCRLVAVAHDGAIALREEPGWATSFVARLPVEARPATAETAPPISRAGNA
jgi:two-component system sensor histidine kinase KdpD